MKRIKKRVINTAALGLALLVTPTLTYRSAINTYAQAALTAEEEAKIQAFLATEPQNNDTTNLGKVKVDQPTSGYTFPGVNNYTSLFKTRGQKITLDKDYEFTIDNGNHAGKTVKVKDWANVKGYLVNSMSDAELGYENGLDKYMFTDEVTLIDQADGSEFTVKNAVLSLEGEEGYRMFDSLWTDRYVFDLPIEESDPRFKAEIEDASLIPLFGNGYWTLHATVTEMVPYETIVKIDESLKTGEVEEDVAGVLGSKAGKYDIMYSPYEDLQGDTYKQYTSDVIYADLLENVDTEPAVNDMLSKPWGDATVTDFTSSPATDRVLRVGIDYTHFVTEDGTPVTVSGANVDKKFGLKDKENFEGYEYVTTRTEANGDRVHVYKKIVETPAEPENTPTPETPETPAQPEAPAPATPETPAQPEAPSPATPETPAQPEAPAPVTPETPAQPEAPAPVTPETPAQPEAPAPATPETPVQPEAPAPATPETPAQPEAPAPVTPETPAQPEAPAPVTPETPAQPVAPAVQSTPKTGDAGLFTSAFMLFTGMIGSVGAFITKKKNSK